MARLSQRIDWLYIRNGAILVAGIVLMHIRRGGMLTLAGGTVLGVLGLYLLSKKVKRRP